MAPRWNPTARPRRPAGGLPIAPPAAAVRSGARPRARAAGAAPMRRDGSSADYRADDLLETCAGLGLGGPRSVERGKRAVAVHAGLIAGVFASATALEDRHALGHLVREEAAVRVQLGEA